MGNEVSGNREGDAGGLPPLVLQIEAILWPGVATVACEIFLQDSDASQKNSDAALEKTHPRENLGQASTASLPSKPFLIHARSVSSTLTVDFYEGRSRTVTTGGAAGDAGRKLTSVVMPLFDLVSLGAPLYTSLWLGLDKDPLKFSDALQRAQVLNAPKLRFAVFKPCQTSLTRIQLGDKDGRARAAKQESSAGLWTALPRPDVYGAFQDHENDASGGAGCVGRDNVVPGLTLPLQVKGLIDGLRRSNDTISNLQVSAFQQQQQLEAAPQTVVLRVSMTEVTGPHAVDSVFIVEQPSGRSKGFVHCQPYSHECTDFPFGEPVRFTVRPYSDEGTSAIVLCECSIDWQDFYPKAYDGVLQLDDKPGAEPSTVRVTIEAQVPEAQASKQKQIASFASLPSRPDSTASLQSLLALQELNTQLDAERAAREAAEKALANSQAAFASMQQQASPTFGDTMPKADERVENALAQYAEEAYIWLDDSTFQFDCEEVPAKLQGVLKHEQLSAIGEVINVNILALFAQKWGSRQPEARKAAKDELKRNLPTPSPPFRLSADRDDASFQADIKEVQVSVADFLSKLPEPMPYLTWSLDQIDGKIVIIVRENLIPLVRYLKQELSDTTARTEALQTSLGEATPRHTELCKELSVKDEELERARSAQAALLDLQNQLSLKDASFEASLLDLQNQLSLKDASVQSSEAVVTDLQNRLAVRDQALRQATEEQDNQLKEARQREAALNSQLESLKEALDAAEKACAFKDPQRSKKEEALQLQLQQEATQREIALQAALDEAKHGKEESDKERDLMEESFNRLKEAEIRKVHVQYEVQQAKLRAELKVLTDSEEENRRLLERVKTLEAELVEARHEAAGAPRSLPDVNELHQQAELESERKKAAEAAESERKKAAEAREKEIDAMKARLESESAKAQKDLAMRQKEDIEDLERRQEATLKLLEEQHKASLSRLEDRLAAALKVHENVDSQVVAEDLRTILVDCTEMQARNPLQSSTESLHQDPRPAVPPEERPILVASPPKSPNDERTKDLTASTASSLEGVKEEAVNVAAAGLDTNGDGQIDYIMVGEDRDRDGIPDVIQASSPKPASSASSSLRSSKASFEWEEKSKSRQGTVRCNQCSALNMINLDGPPTVQCGQCSNEFMVVTGNPSFGTLTQVAEESPDDTAAAEMCDKSAVPSAVSEQDNSAPLPKYDGVSPALSSTTM